MNPRVPRSGSAEILAQQAADWLTLIRESSVTPGQIEKWEHWLLESDDHWRAFQGVEYVSGLIDQHRAALKEMPLEPEDSLRAGTAARSGTQNSFVDPRSSRRDGKHPWSLAAGLACIATLITVMLGGWEQLPQENNLLSFTTGAAQHRLVTLADGSSVVLGAKTSLLVDFTASRRTVMLTTGEAMFDVEENASRPFVVIAGSGTIRALGTSFNVRHALDRVKVAVASGEVEVMRTSEVEPVELRPISPFATPVLTSTVVAIGQQAILDGSGVSRISAIDPASAAGWQAGTLQYEATPIKYVIADVNRYSMREIIIADESVGDLPFSGTVPQDRIDEWLPTLEEDFPLHVVELNADKVLLARRDSQ